MKARTFQFIFYFICRHQTNIISLHYMYRICKADRESSSFFDILSCFMAFAQAQHYFITVINTAPCGIHCICLVIFIIAANNQYRQRIKPCFLSKILSHNITPFLLLLYHQIQLTFPLYLKLYQLHQLLLFLVGYLQLLHFLSFDPIYEYQE